MAARRFLLIGSQNKDSAPLSFLPQAAEDLYRVMTDAALGGCLSSLEQGGWLSNPTVAQTVSAIESSFRRAAAEGACLLLAYIGHGVHAERDFYLCPSDADASTQPTMFSAVAIIPFLKQLQQKYTNSDGKLDGLVLLLDTCSSGVAASEASSQWINALDGSLRFEVLTAAADRPAHGGCFSKSLTRAIQYGVAGVPAEYLRCADLRKFSEQACPSQTPQHLLYNADEGLYLSRNSAHSPSRDRPWIHTTAEVEIERLTEWFQPTKQLKAIVDAAAQHRYLAVSALAGSGKSALTAALAEPNVTNGLVPRHFLQAAVFVSESTLPSTVFSDLATQLRVSVPGFLNASEQILTQTPKSELLQWTAFERHLLRPLQSMATTPTFRIAIDGLDRLSLASAPAIYSALQVLLSDPSAQKLNIIVTCRPDTSLPADPTVIELAATDDDAIRSYAERRSINAEIAAAITQRAHGNWLIARLLSDIAPLLTSTEQASLPSDLVEIYQTVLLLAGAADATVWASQLKPVLAVLAVAGTGPVLPIEILCHAAEQLGGSSRPADVRDILVKLRGFVVRGNAGTDDEHVGLFHQTFAEYLLSANLSFNLIAADAHEAILHAITELAPLESRNRQSNSYRYAAAREAEHLVALERYPEAIHHLAKRESGTPAENLSKWQVWSTRLEKLVSPDSPAPMMALNQVAYWTGELGRHDEALKLATQFLLQLVGKVPSTHRIALTAKANVANWTAATRNYKDALPLLMGVLLEQSSLLGPSDPDTVRTLNNIGMAIANSGNIREALVFFEGLLTESELPEIDPLRLSTESNLIKIMLDNGLLAAAGKRLGRIGSLAETSLGAEDPVTLRLRVHLASCAMFSGDYRAAASSIENLLPIYTRVFGADHPDTLGLRLNLAHCAGLSGDLNRALNESLQVLPDLTRVLGPWEPETLIARNNVAHYTAETGHRIEGERLFRDLLPDQNRILGPKHPDTLRLRHNIARWSGINGRPAEALRLFNQLLTDRQEVLGSAHPETFRTRHNIAYWTAIAGSKNKAIKLWEKLLAEEESALGPTHPVTSLTRKDLAAWKTRR